ncbi:MAG: GNAT family N-acetyltransferase [Chloroflexi bacterium]|nr:GNAT family N-acetyltransferase [Chloroflexota bacterium]
MSLTRFKTFSKALLTSLRTGQFKALLKEFRRRIYSDWTHFGLARDLTQPFEPAPAKIAVTIRPLKDSDVASLLAMDAPGISDRGPYVRMHRLNFLQANIGTCYVGVTDDDTPCYMQWLMSAKENDAIQAYFHGIFPVLEPNEALLEYAFTPEAFQGKGIMPYAMARITEKATDLGAKRVITFVDHQNIAALKGCKRAGFNPYLTRTDQWRFFRRHYKFTLLPAGTPYPFDIAPPAVAAPAQS